MARGVADILTTALAEADRRGLRRPRVAHLNPADVQVLAEATLTFLRTRRSKPSPVPGWQQVGNFDAGVNRWWNAELGEPFPSDVSLRLQTLREEIYDHLEDVQHLILKQPGHTSPIHLAPDGVVLDDEDLEAKSEQIIISARGAGFGDPETNRKVELAAINAVIAHFAGWIHDDVSLKKCGWDITFRRGSVEVHAEVKGVSGRRPSILLTRNEYQAAEGDSLWRLFVVTRALVAPSVQEFDREAAIAASEPYVYRTRLDGSDERVEPAAGTG